MNENLTLSTPCTVPCSPSRGSTDCEPCTTSSGLQTFTGALFLFSLALILTLVFLA